MNHLLKELAPFSSVAWERLEEGARATLHPSLAARRLVEVHAPLGWDHSATNLGRTERLVVEPAAGVKARQRVVLALVELRADFSLSLEELADAERGAGDLDLAPLDEAARELAIAENVIVFHGYDQAGIAGITQASQHTPLSLGRDLSAYPRQVAKAVGTLRVAGVGGPYGLALGPDAYTGVVETAEHGGVLLLDHLRRILEGPVVWAPGVDGAVVVSLRGGDFHLECGSDISLGYAGHDAERVRLYLEESCSFRVSSPEAAVALRS